MLILWTQTKIKIHDNMAYSSCYSYSFGIFVVD